MGESWLSNCRREHLECALHESHQIALPTRVINVGSMSQPPFLHVSGNDEIGKWVALSYCWGGDSPFTLNKDSFSRLQSGLPLSDFPPTLRDAILVTRALGVQYIWIDSLCIFQDDANDWAIEASRMGNVYRYATLTIAATSAESVNAGFLDKREQFFNCALTWSPERGPQDEPQNILQKYPIFARKVHRRAGEYFTARSRWASRGWTFQEELLSPRLLQYTPGRMVWRCPKGVAIEPDSDTSSGSPYLVSDLKDIISESNNESQSVNYDIQSLPIDVTYKAWYSLVSQYSSRYLTYDKDCLPAIAGFAKFFQAKLNDQYCAGLWKQDMLYGLLWSTWPKDSSTGGKSSAQAMREISSERARPSWSWITAFDMKMDWPHRSDGLTYSAKLIDVEVYGGTGDDFGRISGGKLTLEAPYRDINLRRSSTVLSLAGKLQKLTEIVLDRPEYLAGTESSRSAVVSLSYIAQRFILIEVMRCSNSHRPGIWLLVLQPVAVDVPEAAGQQVYRRVALVYLQPWEYDDENSKEEEHANRLQDAAYRAVQKEVWLRSTFAMI